MSRIPETLYTLMRLAPGNHWRSTGVSDDLTVCLNVQRWRLRTSATRGVSGKAMLSSEAAYCNVSVLLHAQQSAHRSGDIGTGDTLRRSVKEVESVRLADLSDNLGSNTER